MCTIKLTLAYDGTDFCGWQIQDNGPSVQGALEDAVKAICGDTVRVHAKVVEGDKERVQVFEGVVIAWNHESARECFTVRKISHGVGVERTFLLNSPRIEKIEVARHGLVRRAKLYYLRGKVGKATRIKEDRNAKR